MFFGLTFGIDVPRDNLAVQSGEPKAHDPSDPRSSTGDENDLTRYILASKPKRHETEQQIFQPGIEDNEHPQQEIHNFYLHF